MYDRFSDDARKAMQTANRIATEQGHTYITSEDIFLGALGQGGTLAQACDSLGVTPTLVDRAVKDRLATVMVGPVQRAKAVVERAIQQARDFGHQSVCIHHLALAVLAETDGQARAALESACISPSKLEAEIVRLNPPCKPSLATFSAISFQQLLSRFKDEPEILPLRVELERIQREKENAVANQQWETAARYRDQGDQLKKRLLPILRRLNAEADRPDE